MRLTTVGQVFGNGSQAVPNPFKRGEDGNIPSPGAISALIRSDPVRAVALCKEAGEP